jgi:hypothetical protein
MEDVTTTTNQLQIYVFAWRQQPTLAKCEGERCQHTSAIPPRRGTTPTEDLHVFSSILMHTSNRTLQIGGNTIHVDHSAATAAPLHTSRNTTRLPSFPWQTHRSSTLGHLAVDTTNTRSRQFQAYHRVRPKYGPSGP